MDNPFDIILSKLDELENKVTILTDKAGKDDQQEELLTTTQLASKLGVSRQTIWKLTRTGSIKSIQLGRSRRYRLTDILEKLG